MLSTNRSLLLQIAAATHSREVSAMAEQLARSCSERYTIYLGNSPTDIVQARPGVDSEPALLWDCTRYKEMYEDQFPVPANANAIYKIEKRQERGYTVFELVLSVAETDEKACEWAKSIEQHPLPQTWKEWGDY